MAAYQRFASGQMDVMSEYQLVWHLQDAWLVLVLVAIELSASSKVSIYVRARRPWTEYEVRHNPNRDSEQRKITAVGN